jgi:hypothetical protein
MKRARAITTVTVVGVASLVLLELLKGWLAKQFGLHEEVLVRIEVGGVTLLILIVINLVFHLSTAQAEETVAEIAAQISSMRGSEGHSAALSSSTLYRELVTAAEGAQHRVYSAYLGTDPPAESNLPEKQKYFEALRRLAKKKRRTAFRRIVLLTGANMPWIDRLTREYEGYANVSIAIYRHPEGAALPLSIQLFDDARLFMVHAAARPPGQPRDIMINDRVIVSILNDYYEYLWRVSELVLESGRIQTATLEALRSQT